MKRLFALFFLFPTVTFAADVRFVDCGPGFIATAGKNRYGISVTECKKLWCKDLENGKSMGSGDTPTNGYAVTGAPIQLCDNKNNCVECFGDRKWCPGIPGEVVKGEFNPEYGAYTRVGTQGNVYKSSLAGNCWRWQLQCSAEAIALGNSACVTQGAGGDGRSAIKARALRRTSVMPTMRKKR